MSHQPSKAAICAALGFGLGGSIAAVAVLALHSPLLAVVALAVDGAIAGLSLRQGFRPVLGFALAFPLTAVGFYAAALAAVADLASAPIHDKVILPVLGITYWLIGSLGSLTLRRLGEGLFSKALFSFACGAASGVIGSLCILAIQSWPSAGSAVGAYVGGFIIAHVVTGCLLGWLLAQHTGHNDT